jgi:transcriptional regulator with XRE-family HTH domain
MQANSITKRILKYRKLRGWSQERLAREAEIPFTTLTKIENGATKNPSIETLIKIVKALEIKVDDLLNND